MGVFFAIKKGDYLVMVIIAAAAAALFVFGQATPGYGQAATAMIEVNNEVVKELSLDYTEPHFENISLARGEATLEIHDGRIRVIPMPRETCPLGICSSVGWIKYPRQAIVCLPNSMVITIAGQAEHPLDLDGITD